MSEKSEGSDQDAEGLLSEVRINPDSKRYYDFEMEMLKTLDQKIKEDGEENPAQRLHELVHAHGNIRLIEALNTMTRQAANSTPKQEGGHMSITPETSVKFSVGVLATIIAAGIGWAIQYSDMQSAEAVKQAMITKANEDNAKFMKNIDVVVNDLKKQQSRIEDALRDYQEEATRISSNQTMIIEEQQKIRDALLNKQRKS